MKRKILIAPLVLALMCTYLTGCGTESGNKAEEEKTQSISELVGYPDYAEVYDGLLVHFSELIQSPDAEDLSASDIAVAESAKLHGGKNALDMIGYTITDVSGDGNPELVIGEICGENEDGKCGSNILCVFTADSKEPVFSFGADTRSSYYFTNDGRIYHTASNKDGETMFSLYTINETGKSIDCYDFYFTHEDKEHPENSGFYHNVTGEWIVSVSDKMDISERDFFAIAYDITTTLKEINLTPFSRYGAEQIGSADVKAEYAKDKDLTVGEYYEFVMDDGEFSTSVAFSTDKDIENFRLLSLEYIDDGSDEVHFETSELFGLEKLTSEKPFVVSMTFAGAIPGYGISYTDTDGKQKRFSVNISGFDGSLILSEF